MNSEINTQHPPHPCPACGYYMFSMMNDQGEICLICGWQNDLVDLEEMYRPMGPNHVSLEDAQKSFEKIGVIESRFVGKYGASTKKFIRDPKWRPLDRSKDKPRKIDNSQGINLAEQYYWYWY